MREEDVVRWLEQFEKIDEMILSNMAEQKKAMSYSTKCTSKMDGMPLTSSKKADRVSEGAVRIISLEEENISLQRERLAKLEKMKLLPPSEYGVLYRTYVSRMTQWQIACEMNYSTVSVWRIKKRAVRMLGEILASKKKG